MLNSLSKQCLYFREHTFLSHTEAESMLMLIKAYVLTAPQINVSNKEHVQDTQMSKLRFLSKRRVEA